METIMGAPILRPVSLFYIQVWFLRTELSRNTLSYCYLNPATLLRLHAALTEGPDCAVPSKIWFLIILENYGIRSQTTWCINPIEVHIHRIDRLAPHELLLNENQGYSLATQGHNYLTIQLTRSFRDLDSRQGGSSSTWMADKEVTA